MDVGGGLRKVARQTVASFLRLGEEVKFAVRGRPAPEDAIVVAAAGRSGSTWLADLLAAAPGLQEIFEPFHPQHSALYRQLVGVQANHPRQYKRVYLRSGAQYPQWDVLLEQALTGQIRSYRTDYQRRRFLPDRYVVKFIRANMMLGYLADRFQPQIVFLTRHPCAVVYSRLHRVREPWFADVKDLLVDEALVADYLQPWLRYVEQEKDLLGTHALWWAVENAVARHDLATRAHLFVFYESLFLRPEDVLNRLYTALGYPGFQVPAELVHQPSRVAKTREYEDKVAWLGLWQERLSAEEQRRILVWAERLEIPWYGEGPLPVRKPYA